MEEAKGISPVTQRIIDFRKEQAYTLRGFANEIGVSPTVISLMENGKYEPSLNTIRKICERFNCNPAYFSDGLLPVYRDNVQGRSFVLNVESPITDADKEIITSYLNLPEPSKKMIQNLIKAVIGDD